MQGKLFLPMYYGTCCQLGKDCCCAIGLANKKNTLKLKHPYEKQK